MMEKSVLLCAKVVGYYCVRGAPGDDPIDEFMDPSKRILLVVAKGRSVYRLKLIRYLIHF